MDIPKDEKFHAWLIDRLVPFPKILEANGYEGYSYDGKVYCPFHDNYESPAGKIYHDKKGDTLWCFSEQKRYRPSDLYKKKLNRKGTLSSIAENLWKQLSEDTQKGLLDECGRPTEFKPEGWDENIEKLSLFKKGKVSFAQHMSMVRELL